MVAPLVLLAGELLHPPFQRDPARLLAVAAANPDRWYLAHLLSLIGFALLVPAILGLIQLVGQRRAALADLGGTLALLGVLAASGLLSIDGFGVWQMAQPAADRAEMAALLDRILTSPRDADPVPGVAGLGGRPAGACRRPVPSPGGPGVDGRAGRDRGRRLVHG
jgi:hypothetical protein